MKQLISVILLAVVFAFSAAANADSATRNLYNKAFYQTGLTIDTLSNNQDYVSADLFIDMEQDELTFTLWGASNCPEDAICIALVGPMTQSFVATELNFKRNWCGAVMIEGSASYQDEIDSQEQRGEFKLTAIDFSKGICRLFFDVPATAVNFERTYAYVMDYNGDVPVMGEERFQFGNLVGGRLNAVSNDQ